MPTPRCQEVACMMLTVRLVAAAGGSPMPMARRTYTLALSHPLQGQRLPLMPPRFGCSPAAPQTIAGWCRGQAERATPATRPACSIAQRVQSWRGGDVAAACETVSAWGLLPGIGPRWHVYPSATGWLATARSGGCQEGQATALPLKSTIFSPIRPYDNCVSLRTGTSRLSPYFSGKFSRIT